MGGIPLISRKWRPLLCAHKLLKYPMDLTTPISLATPNQSSLNCSIPNYSITLSHEAKSFVLETETLVH